MTTLFHVLVFPGLLYVLAASLLVHWLDRKLVALFQGRVGPPVYQPLADIIKLFAKEDITIRGADAALSAVLPIVSIASVLTAALYVPVGDWAAADFEADLIVVLFLLSIPTLGYFMAGWTAPSFFGALGGNRSLLQYFSYEVPLLLGLTAPALLTRCWSIMGLVSAQAQGGWSVFWQPVGFMVSVVGLIGKLKRVPFDIPHAKSEVGAGPLTEYSGRKLALWKLTVMMQTLVGVNLLVAVYLGGGAPFVGLAGFAAYGLKAALMVTMLALVQVLFARVRIDQMAAFGWLYLVPAGLAQMLFTVWMGRL